MPATSGDSLAEGPPWFISVVLYKGDSDEFAEFFDRLTIDLDQATGKGLHIAAVGNSAVAGKVYAQRRSKKQADKDRKAQLAYPRLVATRGGETHLRRWETDSLVKQLQVDKGQLPCIAFWTYPRLFPVALLRIETRWLRDPDLREALGAALCSNLGEDRILKLGKPGKSTVQDLLEALAPVLNDIRDEMAYAESKLAARAGVPRPPIACRFPLPPGARWEEVQIRFIDEEEIEITFRRTTRSYRYDMVGLIDRRNGRPNREWTQLYGFAVYRGELSWNHMKERGPMEKRVERLAAALKAFFGMDEPPFVLTRGNRRAKGWRAKFTIHHDE